MSADAATRPPADAGAGGAPALKRHRLGSAQRLALLALRYLVVLAALAFFLFPIAWVLGTAFKLHGGYMHRPPIWIPDEQTLLQFRAVMASKGEATLRNSVVIATSATILSTIIGRIAA